VNPFSVFLTSGFPPLLWRFLEGRLVLGCYFSSNLTLPRMRLAFPFSMRPLLDVAKYCWTGQGTASCFFFLFPNRLLRGARFFFFLLVAATLLGSPYRRALFLFLFLCPPVRPKTVPSFRGRLRAPVEVQVRWSDRRIRFFFSHERDRLFTTVSSPATLFFFLSAA